MALILPRLTSIWLLGVLGSYELKSHPRESGDIDDRADFDRAAVEIDRIFRLGKINRDGHTRPDDDLAFLNMQGAALKRARRAKDRRDEPPAAGNGVDLAGLARSRASMGCPIGPVYGRPV